MSVAEPFLRGGRPCTSLRDLTDLVSGAQPPYSSWRCVSYYPRSWHLNTVENRVTAPVLFFIFACRTSLRCPGSIDGGTADPSGEAEATWHLLYYTLLSEGALPTEIVKREYNCHAHNYGGNDEEFVAAEYSSKGGGGSSALRAALRALPAALHPSGPIEWYSLADGIAYERMNLLSAPLFHKFIVPAVRSVLTTYWRPTSLPTTKGEENTGPFLAIAHYVLDGRLVERADLLPIVETSTSGAPPGDCDRRSGSPIEYNAKGGSNAPCTVSRFSAETMPRVMQWLSSQAKPQSFLSDASVPSISETGWRIMYPILPQLQSCLYTSLFQEADHIGKAVAATSAAAMEALSGVAKLRAEREAGLIEWKRRIGEYTTFTVPTNAWDDDLPEGPAPSTTPPPSSRPFQHVLLLQRPIVEKTPVDIDNRDAGPLAPQPIGAELHLLQDRGDVLYAVDQLNDRSNLHFVFEDTVHDDGEVLVQLAPVEGVPFCDLEAFFRAFPPTSPVFGAGCAAHCADSCCTFAIPRVLFRRPTGRTQKANPMARAMTELELCSPTPAMLKAASAALLYISSQAVELTELDVPDAAATAAPVARTTPSPGYTLHLPSVDFCGLPSKRCGWCSRRREQLRRCGGCKAVSYCSSRHQAMDWKEGAHKSECVLWRRARELQEGLVAPWAAQTHMTWMLEGPTGEIEERPKSLCWSYAATLVDFLQTIAARTNGVRETTVGLPENAVMYVHLVGLEAECVEAFIRALAGDRQLREALVDLTRNGAIVRQLRFLVCSDRITDAQRNAVWAIKASGKDFLWRTASTGVLGDAWHCHGESESAEQAKSSLALVRLNGVKYHLVERHHGSHQEGTPCAILSFGPATGEGCNYFNAALEVFAAHDVARAPLRFVDSSYVGAVRTRDAVAARVAGSDACDAAVKNQMAALVAGAKLMGPEEPQSDSLCSGARAGRRSFAIQFNSAGAAPVAMWENYSPTCTQAGANGGNMVALTPFVNAFEWDIYPTDFHPLVPPPFLVPKVGA